jgi:hypothetical protein
VEGAFLKLSEEVVISEALENSADFLHMIGDII